MAYKNSTWSFPRAKSEFGLSDNYGKIPQFTAKSLTVLAMCSPRENLALRKDV